MLTLLLACVVTGDSTPGADVAPAAVDADGDGYAADVDCEDGDPQRWPVTFLPDDGPAEDHTERFSGLITADVPGTMLLCPGTWPVRLSINTALSVEGVGSADAVVLSGQREGSVVSIEAA